MVKRFNELSTEHWGVKVGDRFKTIKGLSDPNATRQDFKVPGHVFPLQAMDGGVLRRAGHTEAAVDLCLLADHYPVAVICEIINDDGSMARIDDLVNFSKKHDVAIGTIKDLIEYKLKLTNPVSFVSKAKVPTEYGEFTAHVYKDNNDNKNNDNIIIITITIIITIAIIVIVIIMIMVIMVI